MPPPSLRSRSRRTAALALSLFLLVTGSARAQTDAAAPGGEGPLVIEHVKVLRGWGGSALTGVRVIVQDGNIARLEPSTAPVPSDARVINGAGGYLLPGFIDMHAHLLFPRCAPGSNGPPRFDRPLSERVLSRLLDFGITTVRSPATPTLEGLAPRDALNAGRVPGPDAVASAELINDPSLSDVQLRQLVRESLPSRPDAIKAYARLRPEQVAVVADEAHRHGLPVIGHLQRTSWAEGVRLGVDHLAHAVDWSVNSLPPPARPLYEKALRTRAGFRSRIDWLELFAPDTEEMQQRVAYEGKFSPPTEGKARRHPSPRPFPELRRDWERCADATAGWTADDYRRWRAARPKLLRWVKQMSDGGVLLVSGTDLTNEWVIPGEGLHQEFELLAEAGLSPDVILRMTGAHAAEALRRTDVGVIEAGRRADLVLLSADPRQDIRNTRRIVWVMQNGKIVSRGPGGRESLRGPRPRVSRGSGSTSDGPRPR